MNRLTPDIFLDDDVDADAYGRPLPPRPITRLHPRRSQWRTDHAVRDEIVTHTDPDWSSSSMAEMTSTLNATKEEREWIVAHLGRFYDGKVLTEVRRRVKGGKEANVYCCAAHPATGLDLIAAKLYRPRLMRSLKNDALYRQGRPVLNAQGQAIGSRDWRLRKAIQNKTKVGLEAQQTSWLEYEFQTMQRLYDAGADVPRPLKHGSNAILMEYVGDEVIPAPPLIHVKLEPDEAHALFERLMRNVEVMLSCQLVHGDLSAYNVLYWEGEIKIIDFPQVVDPRSNPEARAIFDRDVERLCQYFVRSGVKSYPAQIADAIWARCVSAQSQALRGGEDEYLA